MFYDYWRGRDGYIILYAGMYFFFELTWTVLVFFMSLWSSGYHYFATLLSKVRTCVRSRFISCL